MTLTVQMQPETIPSSSSLLNKNAASKGLIGPQEAGRSSQCLSERQESREQMLFSEIFFGHLLPECKHTGMSWLLTSLASAFFPAILTRRVCRLCPEAVGKWLRRSVAWADEPFPVTHPILGQPGLASPLPAPPPPAKPQTTRAETHQPSHPRGCGKP